MDESGEPPVAEFAFPGPLRDRLVAAILDGTKTSTTSLLREFEVEGVAAPRIGDRATVVDSAGTPVAIIETTEARVARLADVDLAHVIAEGEGQDSVEEWRAGHVTFWQSAEMRTLLGDPTFTVDDETELQLERFVVVSPL